jgi:hypothetical protein
LARPLASRTTMQKLLVSSSVQGGGKRRGAPSIALRPDCRADELRFATPVFDQPVPEPRQKSRFYRQAAADVMKIALSRTAMMRHYARPLRPTLTAVVFAPGIKSTSEQGLGENLRFWPIRCCWFASTRGRPNASVDPDSPRSRRPKPTTSETCSRRGLGSTLG